MISACAGQCYFDYINLVRGLRAFVSSDVKFLTALVWVCIKRFVGMV